jgi:acetylornithine/succinyldiaminopimelate/putrescine aminotransferase
VIFRVPEPLPDAATVVQRAQEQNVLVSAFAARTVRAVTHLNVDAAQCRHAAEVLAAAVAA